MPTGVQLSYPWSGSAKLRAGKSLREARGGVDQDVGIHWMYGCHAVYDLCTADAAGGRFRGWGTPIRFCPSAWSASGRCSGTSLWRASRSGATARNSPSRAPTSGAFWRAGTAWWSSSAARLRSGVPAREAGSGALRGRGAATALSALLSANSTRRDSASEQADPARWRFYNEFLADWRHYFAIDGVAAERPRSAAHVRLLPADPARLRDHVSRHHRQLPARRPVARGRVAIHFHARHAALPAHALRAHGRVRHADHGALGHRQGTGGARHRGIALRCRSTTGA